MTKKEFKAAIDDLVKKGIVIKKETDDPNNPLYRLAGTPSKFASGKTLFGENFAEGEYPPLDHSDLKGATDGK